MADLPARDSLVASQGSDAYWVNGFEDDITELGIRAARWSVEENDGGNRADIMLEEWAGRGYGRIGARQGSAGG
jgi:hypothetical protein